MPGHGRVGYGRTSVIRRWGRKVAVLTATVTVTLSAATTFSVFAKETDAIPSGCDTGSWVAGVTNLCRGDVVYRDYIYDDYGADIGAPPSPIYPIGSVSTTGDVRYPKGEENTADLRELRLSLRGDRLVVTFTLNALYDAGSTIGAIAIDTDHNPATGGGRWPTVAVSSTGWDLARVFRGGMPGVAVDTTANTITGSIPMPAGTTVRIQAVTAQSDGTVMNVAFRGTREYGTWFEDRQAAALSTGDISGFGFWVPVNDLRAATTKVADVPPGLHERVYESEYSLGRGEGMSYEGIPGDDGVALQQRFHYFGAHQPYAVYLPDKPGPHGVQLALHGFGNNFKELVMKPGFQQQMGEARNRIIVAPLGRGPAGWYSGPSERDVIDALDDAERSYPVDRDREFISGYSMGGYGTYRLAELHPDRFAGFIDWVGWSDCLNGTPAAGACPDGPDSNPLDYVRNLRWVPGGLIYAGADEAVHATTAAGLQKAFAATGYPYQWWFHPAAEHGSFGWFDDWRKESLYTANMALVRNPPRVTYRYDPSLDAPDYGLVHDHAYWVSRLRTAHTGSGDVDLTTQACGGSLPVTAETTGAGRDPVPWISKGADAVGSTPLPRAARVTGTLNNVAALTVDAKATCLAAVPFSYDITTDASCVVRFSDGRILQLPGPGRHVGSVR